MAILKANDARGLEGSSLADRLSQALVELNRERGLVRTGGRATNPGRIRELKRTVARILTIIHEKKLGLVKKIRERKAGKTASAAAPQDAKPEKKPEAAQTAAKQGGKAAQAQNEVKKVA
ncbi:50S ribosomal protein L29 [Candidatus Parvarchaeota archaeon]|nr:50S ribosomal protein L29 [Candidatus Parvarchaeota archaeon]